MVQRKEYIKQTGETERRMLGRVREHVVKQCLSRLTHQICVSKKECFWKALKAQEIQAFQELLI